MPRPELYPVKKVIGFDQALLNAIDKWRRRQTPIPTVSDAIRVLLEQALASPIAKGRPSPEAAHKALKMAARTVDDIADKSLPEEERKTRKRRLIRGPGEFRGLRADQPKSKG
jgi:hypothetical protein